MTTSPYSAQAEKALSLARRGWHVFPLLAGDKRPAVRDWERRATTDPDRITRCWQSSLLNTAVACGPSKLVVIDLDTAKDGANRPREWRISGVESGEDALAVVADRAGQPLAPLLETYSVRTGSGGLHLYYRAPAGVELRNTAGQLGWLIDTRAGGGYVVAAGSTVAGKTYTVVTDVPPTPLPEWLTQRLTPPAPTAGTDRVGELLTGLTRRGDYANAALRGEIQRVLDATPGTRNNTLVRAAFALGQLVGDGMLPRPLVEDALAAAGQAIGLPAREVGRTVASGLQSGLTKPRGAA